MLCYGQCPAWVSAVPADVHQRCIKDYSCRCLATASRHVDVSAAAASVADEQWTQRLQQLRIYVDDMTEGNSFSTIQYDCASVTSTCTRYVRFLSFFYFSSGPALVVICTALRQHLFLLSFADYLCRLNETFLFNKMLSDTLYRCASKIYQVCYQQTSCFGFYFS